MTTFDETTLTDAEGLRARVLPAPDQARYGPAGTTDNPRYNADGTRRPDPLETP